ncbi:ABC-type amino acid transport substrate-binding protein [Duganella sp. HSC-15S17]|uniref:ABC-type amino acid transport substrate-binding protein n=1 Tax=Duganella violaceipulchra TaxID=2849652 RepID=A0ABT1GL85_9BURK|nr:ABC-type amino acid transport substrate-binding protein [Duganella violaceicalia]
MRRRPATRCALWLALACALAAPSAPALTVGVIDSAPLAYRDAHGAAAGLHVDILTELAARTGIPIDIHIEPKARLLAELKVGKLDGAIFFASPQVELVALDAGVTDEARLVALGRRGTHLESYDDLLRAGTILHMADTTLGATLDADRRIRKHQVNTYEQMARMFVQQRADVIAGNMMVLLYQLRKTGGEQLVEPSAILFRKVDNHLFISKKSPHQDQTALLAQALQEMARSGAIDKFIGRYQGAEPGRLVLVPLAAAAPTAPAAASAPARTPAPAAKNNNPA